MTHQAISDSFLDSRVPACVYQIDLNNFSICVQIRDIDGRLPHYANTVQS